MDVPKVSQVFKADTDTIFIIIIFKQLTVFDYFLESPWNLFFSL